MEKVKLLNFADFFLNFPEDETEKMIAEIEDTGGSVADNQDKILNFLRQKRAELQLQTGKRFKQEYLKLKAESEIKDSEREFTGTNFAIAYRKKTGEEDDPEDEEAKKLDLIRKAKEEG